MQSLNKLEQSLVHIKLKRSLSIQSCFPERNSNPSSATSPFQSGGTITTNEEPNYISRITTSSCFQEIHVDVDPAEVSFDMLPKNPASVLHPPPVREFVSLPLPGYVNGSVAALHQSGIPNRPAPAFLPAPRTKRTTNLIIYVPLYQAALKASGITRIAEVMVKKNKNLPAVRGSQGVTPLHMAALLGHREMVWFLYSVTDDKALTNEDYTGLLIATISSDLYDVALEILQRQPESAIQRDPNGETALHVLARKPSAFSGKSQLGVWQRGIKEVQQKKLLHMQALKLVRCLWEQVLLLDDSQIGDLLRSPSRLLFVAVEFGNFEFIVELIRSYPDLIWKVDEQSRSIFHIAVEHRQEKIFKLIYDIGAHKDLITSYKNKNSSNMLHLAGKLAPSNQLNIVSGAALQMQRELLWFKVIVKLC
ncbi:hypothetical protein F0562_019898 [Nyssa sinensis]|uniref:PGG domain-containing protein n=1 Tax=Nyssa sinensis TaxID=561372 RepID=A0A5J5BR29_9ASTE|nr:hypothetical protein F0562_019898 [Nyssa sinensis]